MTVGPTSVHTKQDPKSTLSVAQKLCFKMQGQNTMFGGSIMSKNTKQTNTSIYMSNGQLMTVRSKLLHSSAAKSQGGRSSLLAGSGDSQALNQYYA